MVNRKRQADILTDEASAGSLLLAVAASKLPLEGLQWDPAVIKREVESAFDVSLPSTNFNKLIAAVNIAISEEYWKSLRHFVVLNNTLYSGALNIDVFDLATMDEIAVGLSECLLIYPTHRDDFSRTIINYINGMRLVERFSIPPTIVQLLFGDYCPTWYDDFAALVDDPMLYSTAYSQAVDKAAVVDDEVLQRLRYSAEQATRAEMPETAEFVTRLVRLLTRHGNAESNENHTIEHILAETP